MHTLNSLKNLGLDDKEQAVYLALLQMEKGTAGKIAEKTNLKRTTAYNALYRLLSEGFVSEVNVHNTKTFIATPPDKLENILENKKRDLQSDLPYLLSIFNTKPMKPKVSYYHGIFGVKQLYEDILNSSRKNDEVLSYIIDDTISVLGDALIELGIKKRIEKAIKLRAIYQSSNINGHKFIETSKEELREVRLVSNNKYRLENEINIYTNKVLIVNYKPEIYGILIESKEAANTQRAIFEMLWKHLK